jgi:adenylate cyclase
MPQAQALTKELIPLAEHLNDNNLKLQAYHAAWTTLFRVSDHLGCLQNTRQGIKLYDPVKHRSHAFLYGGHDPGVCAHNHAALSLWLTGHPDQAMNHVDKSITLAEDLSHPFTLSTARIFGAILNQCRRGYRLTHQYAEATIEVCSEYDVAPQYKTGSTVLQGWAITEGGELDKGLNTMRLGLEELLATGAKANRAYYLAVYANTCVKFEQAELGNAAIDEAVELIDQSRETTWEAEIYRAKGELLMLSPDSDLSEAESAFNYALELTREQGARSLELRAATSLGRLLRDRGEQSQANKLLKPVYDSFTEGLDTPDLIEASKLLETLQFS